MEYLIRGLVPVGHSTGMFGDGGAGKSLLAVHLAFCVATGEPFFGRDVRERAPVLVLDFELDSNESLRRYYRAARGRGLSSIPEGIHYAALSTPLTDEATLNGCITAVQQTGARLVIVDSFAPASCASDQVAPSEVIPFMRQLRRLGTVLLLDHVPKPTATTAAPLRAYGSTYKHNLVRSSLRLERGDSGGMKLTHVKHNFGPLAEPVTFAMTHSIDAVTFDAIGADDERLQGLTERAKTVPERILDELRQFGDDGTTAERLGELLGCSKKTVSNYLSQLRQRQAVESAEFGRWRVPADLPDGAGKVPGKRRT